jgi:hypothetical protein
MALVMDLSRRIVPLDPDIVSVEVTSLKGVAMRPLNVRFGSKADHAVQQRMSALPPIATAKADIASLDQFIGP